MLKKFVVYLILILFTSIAVAVTTTVQVMLDHAGMTIRGNSVSIDMAGFGALTSPGSYRLPYKRMNVILPAQTEDVNWQANYTRETIPITVFPEKNPAFSDGERFLTSISSNKFNEHIRYAGLGHWGDVTFARFDILPYLFDEHKNALEKIDNLSISISYSKHATTSKNAIPPTMKGSESQFLNPEVLKQEYRDSQSRNYDYLIITKPLLFSALQSLKQFHQTQGMQVKMVSVDSILISVPGINNAAKVRNFLINEYQASPFTYLLLVGDVNTVPIQYLCPEPNVEVSVPTDFYYADLSSDFDTDNDGLPGEYSMGDGDEDYGIDFTPELYVGRIPFNDAASINQITSRIIAYENSVGDWKNNILIPGAILNYANEDGNPWPMTNSDTWSEFVKTHIFNGTNVTTMYEQEGLVTSVPSTYDLNQDNFTELLNTNSYGIINWSAHGSTRTSARKVWLTDENQDNIAQSNECDWLGLVDVPTFDNLVNQDGAVFFCASCNNGMLDNDQTSLGETVLLKKAVADVAATRTGWYKIGWQNPGWGGLSSYNYYVLENYVNFHQSIGQAHGNANFLHSNYFLFGDPVDSDGIIWPELQNIYTYLLFGDPAVGHHLNVIENAGEVLVFEPTLTTHSSNLIEAIRSAGNVNVIYTDKLIPSYIYLNNFKAIFVLSGFADNTYNFNNHPDESQLLADYLDAGGRVYLEGDQFSGDMENMFIDKFMADAPFQHLANIINIYGTGQAAGLVWNYNGYNAMNKPFLLSTDVVPVFKTGLDETSDIIGIYHQTDTYKTIASAFELNGITGTPPGLNEILDTILFDYFNINVPTVNHDETAVQSSLSLKTYPNPFSNKLNITTETPKAGKLTIEVYNIRGQKVRTLVSGLVGKGKIEAGWDGCDNNGNAVGSGIYLIRMQIADKAVLAKTLFVK